MSNNLASFAVCMAAVSGGTALAWTSPVLAQLVPANQSDTSGLEHESFLLTTDEGKRRKKTVLKRIRYQQRQHQPYLTYLG